RRCERQAGDRRLGSQHLARSPLHLLAASAVEADPFSIRPRADSEGSIESEADDKAAHSMNAVRRTSNGAEAVRLENRNARAATQKAAGFRRGLRVRSLGPLRTGRDLARKVRDRSCGLAPAHARSQ
ncbi:MAG TPA: hypothetical protein VEI02_06830, partial [Planctomycetota bacterium]|nr:hypothetical protein [Planctomycetota bacterium]